MKEKRAAARRALRKLALLWVLLLLPFSPAKAERSPILDAALTMLEEGNPFLESYNRVTGAGLQARYPLGCPYFWGGRSVRRILEPFVSTQSSEFFHAGRMYLYGLDCVGFTRWVLQQAGYSAHAYIGGLLDRSQYPELEIAGAAEARGEARAALLEAGDLVAIRHHSVMKHVALYIGTLKDFGYTEDTLPEALKPYLGYPLLIHCTGSSDYYERYENYLEDVYDFRVYPPDGGVIVTLLDAPASAATGSMLTPNNVEKPCFELEGYHLQITDLDAEKDSRWIRWRLTTDGNPPPTEEEE